MYKTDNYDSKNLIRCLVIINGCFPYAPVPRLASGLGPAANAAARTPPDPQGLPDSFPHLRIANSFPYHRRLSRPVHARQSVFAAEADWARGGTVARVYGTEKVVRRPYSHLP